jgi:Protein of unknown function (DUF2505)
VGRLVARHVFDTDIDTFWNKVFFEQDFNERQYRDALKFKSWELLELTGEPGGKRTRKVRTEPSSDAPAVVKKLIGDSIAYVEEGTFDPATKVWSFEIITSKMSDKVKIKGRLWVEPKGDKKIERIIECDIEVKIFGVGGAIESFIEKTTKDSYEAAAKFTNQYVHEKGYDK